MIYDHFSKSAIKQTMQKINALKQFIFLTVLWVKCGWDPGKAGSDHPHIPRPWFSSYELLHRFLRLPQRTGTGIQKEMFQVAKVEAMDLLRSSPRSYTAALLLHLIGQNESRGQSPIQGKGREIVSLSGRSSKEYVCILIHHSNMILN